MSKVHMRAPDCSCGHHFICGDKQGPGEKRKKCDRWECVTCAKCLKKRPAKAKLVPYGQTPKPCLPPAYSTDIAAAWEVVENLGLFKNEQSVSGYMIRVQLWQSGERWVIGDWEDQLHVLAEADTAPLAICLAALKAVGAS